MIRALLHVSITGTLLLRDPLEHLYLVLLHVLVLVVVTLLTSYVLPVRKGTTVWVVFEHHVQMVKQRLQQDRQQVMLVL